MTPTTQFSPRLCSRAALAAAAHAQPKEQYTYRCTGKDGKKYYGQTIPQSCLGQPLELINKQGMVVKRIDPEGDEKARLAKEAEAEKKRELEAAQKESMRRNRALLATYTSEKDIEESRKRDLATHQRGRPGGGEPHRGDQEAPGAVPEGARAVPGARQGTAARAPEGRRSPTPRST